MLVEPKIKHKSSVYIYAFTCIIQNTYLLYTSNIFCDFLFGERLVSIRNFFYHVRAKTNFCYAHHNMATYCLIINNVNNKENSTFNINQLKTQVTGAYLQYKAMNLPFTSGEIMLCNLKPMCYKYVPAQNVW